METVSFPENIDWYLHLWQMLRTKQGNRGELYIIIDGSIQPQ